MKKYLLVLEPSGLRILVDEKISYLEAIRQSGQYIASECGGKGICGKCRVVIEPVPKTLEYDRKHLTVKEIENGIRLACKHTIGCDSRVLLMNSSIDTRILIDSAFEETEVSIDQDLSGQYGVAVDIGTTTVVAFLLDLGTGEQIGSSAALNPQIAFGEDLVTRLTAASESDSNRRTLQYLVIECIEELVTGLVNQTCIRLDDVTRYSIVGNTVMHHFFLGLDTSTLSVAPYSPTVKEAKIISASQLGFKGSDAELYCGPLIAGFVGSDITALILSQELYESNEIILGIDIGTNGEIVLSDRGELYACSTAAGSAFEGATISQGMRGQTGAIEHLTISSPSEQPEISVIGQVVPRGLCGSGIVDVVSELRRVELLTPEGTMIERGRIARDLDRGLGYVIVEKQEHNALERVVFTQKDVRQVQAAKAAIFAGTKILMNGAGIQVDEINKIVLAGAFGNYIKPKSALSIGLIPNVPLERVVQVGNTAGHGAQMMLLSRKIREKAEVIAQQVTHVNLAGNLEFQEAFIEGTLFPQL